MSKIMVTGVNGFVGFHLSKTLVEAGHEVIGIGLVNEISDSLRANLVNYSYCDLTNPQDIDQLLIDDVDGIINLAGLAAVGKSFDEPEEYMRVNTLVLSAICDEIIKRGLQSQIRVLAISSGAVYDNHQPMPLTETSKTDSTSSPYAASKLAMEQLAQDYNQNGLECIVARPFNHIGPGQGEGFFVARPVCKTFGFY